jgi:EAL and modified HD-GYP domain-containing signal transduction protein
VTRRTPFIITGAFRRAELDAAYERGAMGSVGVPLDEDSPTVERPAQPMQTAVLELLRLAHERADIAAMEAVVRRDPALVFQLVHLAAGPAAAAARSASLADALSVLGYDRITRWLSRLLRVSSGDGSDTPLLHTSVRRANFLERLADCAPNCASLRDALFLTGALSLLDRTTGTSFTQLFHRAALPAAVSDALIERAGPCATFLALVEAIERSDPINSRKHREALGIAPLDCNLALLRALAAVPAQQSEAELLAA